MPSKRFAGVNWEQVEGQIREQLHDSPDAEEKLAQIKSHFLDQSAARESTPDKSWVKDKVNEVLAIC